MHEITQAFASEGLPLSRILTGMLNEHAKHRTERRGCGFTQSTRFLSTYINQPRSPLAAVDLGIFDGWSPREVEWVAQNLLSRGWALGWRALDEAPGGLLDERPPSPTLDRLRSLPMQLRALYERLQHVESRLFVRLLEYTVTGRCPEAPTVPGMPDKPDIGSCSQAEEFFLEIANGRVRRHGCVNIIVDGAGAPVLVEKINLGESHSAMVVAPIRINDVLLPVGSLCALKYPDEAEARGYATAHGRMLPLSAIEQTRFLRLTTLAVPVEVRRRAFSAQVEVQLRSNFFSPLSTTITQLLDFARSELGLPV